MHLIDRSPASTSHNLNTWYQIAVTNDWTSTKIIQIWLNGAGGATNNVTETFYNNSLYSLRIGAGANDNGTGPIFIHGMVRIDEMRYSSAHSLGRLDQGGV